MCYFLYYLLAVFVCMFLMVVATRTDGFEFEYNYNTPDTWESGYWVIVVVFSIWILPTILCIVHSIVTSNKVRNFLVKPICLRKTTTKKKYMY